MVATMNMGIVEENAPGASSTGWERGRRRTRQDQISLGARGPAKLRILGSAPNEENLFLLPDRFSIEPEPFESSIQPFDLMSRRHPLSSTRAIRFNQLRKADCPEGSCDVPASSRRQFFRSEIYFFFLATLRVFFAVFFTALFAFFAFLAFLAMLPS
jgi:hypothetical protein